MSYLNLYFAGWRWQKLQSLRQRNSFDSFHKGWKCVLTHLDYAASAWFVYFSNLTFVTFVLEFWKYFVSVFVHFSHGGRVGKRGTAKLKITARKKHSKHGIFNFVFCWMTLTEASIFKTAQLFRFFSIRAKNAFWRTWITQLVPDWYIFPNLFLKPFN